MIDAEDIDGLLQSYRDFVTLCARKEQATSTYFSLRVSHDSRSG